MGLGSSSLWLLLFCALVHHALWSRSLGCFSCWFGFHHLWHLFHLRLVFMRGLRPFVSGLVASDLILVRFAGDSFSVSIRVWFFCGVVCILDLIIFLIASNIYLEVSESGDSLWISAWTSKRSSCEICPSLFAISWAMLFSSSNVIVFGLLWLLALPGP